MDAARADHVTGGGASERADELVRAAVVQAHGTDIGAGPTVEGGIDDDEVAVGQHEDRVAEKLTARRPDDVDLRRGERDRSADDESSGGHRAGQQGCSDAEADTFHVDHPVLEVHHSWRDTDVTRPWKPELADPSEASAVAARPVPLRDARSVVSDVD